MSSNEPQVTRAEGVRAVQMSLLAAVTGLAAGVVAFALLSLIGLVLNLVFLQRVSFELPNLAEHNLGWWILVVPAAGGLIVGLMAKYGSPKIRGHGIPEAMEAVLTSNSRVSPRVAIFKPLSTVVAIGTGGPFGAEGPIIQTGGALGSLLGQVVRTTASERKVLLACGAAGGMAAIFGTPIAAGVLSIEVLLFEFRVRSFIPLVIATTLATTMRYAIFESGPLFAMQAVDFALPEAVPFYVIFGVLVGFMAIAISKSLFWVEDRFEALPIGDIWRPALGGLGLGAIGLIAPQVLGVGYDTITGILNNEFAVGMLLSVFVFKTLALLVSLGSGTSGGLLAPLFMTGAAGGALFAVAANHLVPGTPLAPGAFALVGMAALFGAASRATFTLIIFAFEITRNYNAILPLMLVCVIATGIMVLFMRNTIMTEKLARRGLRVSQDFEVDPMQRVLVARIMNPHPASVDLDTDIADVAAIMGLRGAGEHRRDALVVVDSDGALFGIVTQSDVLRAMAGDENEPTTAGGICSRNLVTAHADETVGEAVERMLRHDIGRLPVVSRSDPTRLLGYIGRAAAIGARTHAMEEEGRYERLG